MKLFSRVLGVVLVGFLAGCGTDYVPVSFSPAQPSATATAVIVATATQPPTHTAAPVLPTATQTPQETATHPATATPSETATAAPPSASATPQNTATEPPTATPSETATVGPPTPTPTVLVPTLEIVAPQDGSTITTSAFLIEVAVTGGGTVTALLNGSPITLLGGPTHYSLTMNPGAPLQAQNELVARIENALGSATATITFSYQPPKAKAYRITDESDLLKGPLAHNRIGDYMLANDTARFVIQDAPQRDLYSVGTFGGNIIDAELVARPGTDNFLEIQPALNIETVINAQTVEIVNDGEDGTPAIIRTCGPDDLLDFVNPSTIIQDYGLNFPASADDADYDIDACTDYILDAGKPYVQMVTTVFNNQENDLGLYVGDFINGSGELEQWTSSGAGIGALLTADLGILSYIGVGEATGVDYSHVTVPVPGLTKRSSFFTAGGVSYVMQNSSVASAILGGLPSFVIPAHGQRSYTRYFGVGDGSGGNAVNIENEVKGLTTGTLQGCVRLETDGSGLPTTRVSAIRRDAGRGLSAVYVTDADGCFRGTLVPGSYDVGAERRGYPNPGDATAPPFQRVTITAGETTDVEFLLPATGRLAVQVYEQHPGSGATSPVPARIGVIGSDPSPEPILEAKLLTGTEPTGTYYDITGDAVPFGFVWMDYAGADGHLEFDIEPGEYHLFVSRGTEYSIYEQPITITGGQTTAVTATIARVLDTSGFISSDFHVHTINSADSRVNLTDRALQFAGEGIDNVVLTDHHSHTDLVPTIDRLGLNEFLHSTIGEEITTWDYGHFNSYPRLVDPARPSGGSTDWAVAAPAGRDFPVYGSYSASPAEIQNLALTSPTSTLDTIIQINHIDTFFAPLRIDTSRVPPQTFLTPGDRLRFRLDPNGGNLFTHYRTLELWNGAGRGAQAEFLNLRIGIWMNHLNQGLLSSFTAGTDTHEFRNLATAGARTWTAASQDAPIEIDSGEVARSVDAGKATCGQGIYVQTRLRAADGSGEQADLTLGGKTMVRSTNGGVDLDIDVQAPLWAEYDRIEIYANAMTVPTLTSGDASFLFSATPSRVLVLGSDFEATPVEVVPGLAGASRRETHVTVPFRELSADTWFMVVVRGTDGISRPMFPIFNLDLNAETNSTLEDLLDGNLGEGGVLALGATNALYADLDGTEGFQAPLAPE